MKKRQRWVRLPKVIDMLEGMLAWSRDQLLSLDFLGLALLRMKELIPINPNHGKGYRITIDRLLQSFHRKRNTYKSR